MELKDRMRLAREHADLSIEEAADKLGYSSQAVKYWESGVNEPRPIVRAAIEKLYKTKVFDVGSRADDQSYLSELTTEAVMAAKSIMAMPKAIRHSILTIIKELSSNNAAQGMPMEAFSEIPAQKRTRTRPKLVTQGNSNHDGSNG